MPTTIEAREKHERSIMHMLLSVLLGFCLGASSSAALAAETTTYTYDAKGRLIQVVRSGGPVNGTTTAYDHDKADNRKTVKTIGAPR